MHGKRRSPDELPPLSSRNHTFQDLNGRISLWVIKQVEQNERFPTNTEIAKEFEISVRWVAEHMRYYRHHATYFDQLKLLTPSILRAYAIRIAKNGKASDVRLWMELVEGWVNPAALAGIAPSSPGTDDIPIGQLTAENDELRHLENEYWLALRRHTQKPPGNDEVSGGVEVHRTGTSYPDEPGGDGGDGGETSSADVQPTPAAR